MAIIEALRNWRMDTPPVFGIFHITFLVITIVITSLLIYFFRDSNEKVMKKVVFLTWLVIFFFEVGKQLINGIFTPEYEWTTFPFQFCETPLYVLPFLLFINNKKIRSGIICFISTYVFFAGLAVTLVPVTLLTANVFLNIRAMSHHCAQVMIGLYLFSWNRKNFTVHSFAIAVGIFLGLTVVAMILNAVIGKYVPDFNMFYISKNAASELIILRKIQPYIPYAIFLLCYIVGFSVLAFATLNLETLVYKLYLKYKPQPLEDLETKID